MPFYSLYKNYFMYGGNKMKAKYKETIGKYTIVRYIADAVIDPEMTKSKIEAMTTSKMTEADIEKLYMANLVYAKLGPEADIIEDSVAEEIQQKLDARGENRLLLDSGEYIADFRGTEYWIKKSGKWEKERIGGELGTTLPSGAVLPENLTQEQQTEIAVQQEMERIADLSDEKKTEEKNARLHALAREVIMNSEEAELLGEEFDKKEWLQLKKAEIEELFK
jgi:hypothetical protein